MELPKEVQNALNRLHSAGYEAGVVGGCVRDALMGRTPGDYDISTSAVPEQVEQVFAHCPVIPTGKKHGTVTVLADKLPLEITTYRTEGPYRDHRHPDSVVFTDDVTKDLARRDFTMNAIYYDEERGYIDPFGGMDDIKNGLIRGVGIPRERFREDALRILRAVRFSAVLGFHLEKQTKEDAFLTKPFLKCISPERVSGELIKLLTGRNAGAVIEEYIDILDEIIPMAAAMKGFDQRSRYHCYDVLTHTARTVDHVPAQAHQRLAAFFHDMGKPLCFTVDEGGQGHFYGHAGRSAELCARTMAQLRFDNATAERVITLVKYHDYPFGSEEKAVKRALNKFGGPMLFDLLALQTADNLAQAPQYRCRVEHLEQVRQTALQVLEKKQCFSLKALAVNGKDLMALGIKPGPELGQMLNRLLEAVIDGELPNDRACLLGYIEKSG